MPALPSPRSVRRGRSALLVVAALVASLSLASAPAVTNAQERTSVVATTEVLGSVVEQLAGDVAEVITIMPSGANPHSYEPSARDAERILRADIVVSNGLDLEEALLPLLETAEAEGVTWFQAAEHVAVRDLADHDDDHGDEGDEGDEHGDESDEHADADGHVHAADDPHIWTDPLVMRDVVMALEPVLAQAGLEVADHAEQLAAELEALDAEIAEMLAVVPPERRKLVTGHQSLGYFADRYGFEMVGTVIPSLSTSGEPTARELARLIDDIEANDVSVVFTEVGTPTSVAEAVAADSGARLIPLATAILPDGGDYADLIRGIGTTVATALAPDGR